MRCLLNIQILRRPPRVGGHQYVYYLINGFDRVVKNDDIVLFNNTFKIRKAEIPDIPEYTNKKIEYKNLRISKKFVSPLQERFGIPRLEHLCGRFEVYHEPAHDEFPVTNAKRIITIHDLSPIKGRFAPDDYAKEHRRFLGDMASAADEIIADSEFTKQDIVETFSVPEEKVHVVYLAAREDAYVIEDRDVIEEVKRRLSIGREYIIYVGSIERKKNIRNIIKAYNVFREGAGEAPQLVLCGKKGWLSDDIYIEASQSRFKDDIVFTGYLPDPDVCALLNGAMFFLYPSYFEGFGLPVLEAMACGTPVITSNTTSIPEVAGDAAIMVDPDSFEAIADAMARLAGDAVMRRDFRQRGFARNAMFSWDKCAEQTLEVYRSATKRKE